MVAGPLHALALVLASAGAAKLLRPARAATALRQAGLPSGPGIVRALAAGELVLAGAVLGAGGPVPAAGLALAYGGFGWFSWRLRSRSGGAARCGCFGSTEAPAGGLHVVVNAAAAVIAAAAAVAGSPAVHQALAGQPAAGLPYLAAVAAAAWAVVLTLTALPSLVSAERPVREPAGP